MEAEPLLQPGTRPQAQMQELVVQSESYALAGIHEVLEEFHNLAYLLLKKNKRYGGFFRNKPKYDKDILLSKIRLRGLLAQVEKSLPYLETHPELCALLLGREHDLKQPGDPLYVNPVVFYNEYKTLFETLRDTTYNVHLKPLSHVDKENRGDSFVEAGRQLQHANERAGFLPARQYDPETWNPYKAHFDFLKTKTVNDESGIQNDRVKCRYLVLEKEVDGQEGKVRVFEKDLLIKLHRGRGIAQQVTRVGVSFGTPAVAIATVEGVTGDVLQHEIGKLAMGLFGSLTGLALTIGLGGAAYYFSQNVWLKTIRLLISSVPDKELPQSKEIHQRYDLLASGRPAFSNQDQFEIDAAGRGRRSPSIGEQQGVVAEASRSERGLERADTLRTREALDQLQVNAQRRAAEGNRYQDLMAAARAVAGSVQVMMENVGEGVVAAQVRVHPVSPTCKVMIEGADGDSEDLTRALNAQILKLNETLNLPANRDRPDARDLVNQINAQIDVLPKGLNDAPVAIDTLDQRLDELETMLANPYVSFQHADNASLLNLSSSGL